MVGHDERTEDGNTVARPATVSDVDEPAPDDWPADERSSSLRRRTNRLLNRVRDFLAEEAIRYTYRGHRFRHIVSPRRRWAQLTLLVNLVRAAAPDGGYFAAAGRYVYQGRRSDQTSSTRRRRAQLFVIVVGALATAVVAANFTVRPAPRPPERLPALPDIVAPTVRLTPPNPAADETQPVQPSISPAPSSSAPVGQPKPPAGQGGSERSYEAELAFLYGSAEVDSLAGASGGRVVRSLGTRETRDRVTSGSVQFTRVEVAKAGRHLMSVAYVSSDARSANIVINGSMTQTLQFLAGGDNTVVSATFTIDLAAGANNIMFSNPSGKAPRLDRIVVYG